MILLNDYLKKEFGTKVYRLSLSTGCTCPNRDGTVSTGGCTFCSSEAAGEFSAKNLNLLEQIEFAKDKIKNKIPKSIKEQDVKYIAYFQSYSNTYAKTKQQLEHLFELFSQAVSIEQVAVLSIATRPDCLSDDMISFLSMLNKIKPVWVELGLQTIHETTAEKINRGYTLDVFDSAYKKLKQNEITVIVHVIEGLPGETEEMMIQTVKYLSSLTPSLDGIKIQLLQILKGTAVYEDYLRKPFKIYSLQEYGELLVKLLKLLPQNTVVHRITGDGPKKLLVEPLWCADKKRVINYLLPLISDIDSDCL